MQKSQNTSKFYDNLWAAFIFFTRLPFWRVYQPPKSSYAAVVEWWPFTGWLTGGAMATTLYYGSMVMPYAVAVIAAIIVRLLLTGALHEDGLADFFDGFGGGGSDRQRILDIMKDSHIGTYGVLSLILYLSLLGVALFSLSPEVAALTILAANPFSKMITSLMVVMMPYARTEETAKNKTVYRTIGWMSGISLCIQGLLPMMAFLWYTGLSWVMIIIMPCLVMGLLCLLIWRRLRGYTGDCCGAVCLLTELAVCLTVCSLVA
jgi:adenosylcobinamide-GDP ribazoletransferase